MGASYPGAPGADTRCGEQSVTIGLHPKLPKDWNIRRRGAVPFRRGWPVYYYFVSTAAQTAEVSALASGAVGIRSEHVTGRAQSERIWTREPGFSQSEIRTLEFVCASAL